jgi:hypothetical protein
LRVLEPDGEFEMSGTYTLTPNGSDPGPLVGFRITGRFEGDHVEGVEHHIPSFPGGSCDVTFSFLGDEV